MDHRCLYGHRIPEQFSFAIQQRLCPTCGAPCVTLDGYRLARRLTQEVPLEALAAFNVVRILEGAFTLVPKPAEGADEGSTSQQIEVAPTGDDAAEPPAKAAPARPAASASAASAASASAGNASFRSRLSGLNPSASLVPESASDAPPPRRRAGRPDESEAEREFFAGPERS